MSNFFHSHVHHNCAPNDCARRSPSSTSLALSQCEVRQVAARFRLLAHPMRVAIVRELHAADGTILDLAERTELPSPAVRSHLTALYRAGVLRRTDANGPAVFSLVDWADWWVIEQYATRLRMGGDRAPSDRRARP